MKNYRIEREQDTVYIWDDEVGIALTFKEGVDMQRYLSAICVKDADMYESEDGLRIIGRCADELTAFATERWPMEFEEIPNL